MKFNRLIFALIFAAVAAFSAAAGSDVRSQALALYTAIHKQDWRSLYYLAAFSPSIKKQLQGPDKFASDVKSGISQGGDNAKVVDQLFSGIKNIQVGAASVNGNRATVPTSADITFNGQTMHFVGLAKMVNDNGTWKWDLAYTNDLEKATSESLQTLIGKPAK